MSNDIAAARVHPHGGVVRARRVWDKDEVIPRVEAMHDVHSLPKHGSVHLTPERFDVRGR
jgi:hypothetical protein